MDNRAFDQLIARAKDAPELGGGFSVADGEAGRQRLARDLGWDLPAEPAHYTLSEYLEYAAWEARAVFVRPMAAAGAVMGLMLGGFITTVSASASRPGDILYPVKLATERMQLSFAGSPEERVRLHTQFAGERLQEAVDLTASGSAGSADQVKTAVDGFKNELSSAHGELSGLSASAPGQVADAAAALASKADTFSAILSKSEQSAASDVKGDVKSAKDAAKSAQSQAVTTLVNAYETDKTSGSAMDLQQNFRSGFQDVSGRLALTLGRLTVMREALKNLPVERANGFRAFANATQSRLQPLTASLAHAQDLMAAGGYRHAFDLLDAADKALAPAEQAVIAKEIELSTIDADAVQP